MPREWIDVEELRKKHWKKQESKQMTKLEELKAAAAEYDAAADASAALAYARANPAELKKSKENK